MVLINYSCVTVSWIAIYYVHHLFLIDLCVLQLISIVILIGKQMIINFHELFSHFSVFTYVQFEW